MPGLSANMNTLIDINYFNNALLMGGGNEIISNKKHVITMRHFIKILLKLFKKDFDKKNMYSYQRSGGSSSYVDEYAHAYNFSDLTYSNPYPFPLAAAVDRSFT
jgi:hypothetical protein